MQSLFAYSVKARSSSSFINNSLHLIPIRKMGWIWREIKSENNDGRGWHWEDCGNGVKPAWGGFTSPDGIKTVVRSDFTHERIEHGKYLRKGNNKRMIVKMTPGKPDYDVLESKSYYTEDIVTEKEYQYGPPTNFPLSVEDVPGIDEIRRRGPYT